MPHTRRKQKPTIKKRKEVQGEDGWTHVTNTAREPPQAFPQIDDANVVYRDYQPEPVLGTTVESLRAQYQSIKGQWQESEAFKVLRKLVYTQAQSSGKIDKCIVYGTGSFSGLHSGWIDYRDVALCQLAVLETILETLGDELGARPPGYAQELAYNDLDVAFLDSLDVKVLRHPEGIEAVTEQSLAYLPCAEAYLVLEVLKRKPRIMLGKMLADRIWPAKLTMLKHATGSQVEVETISLAPQEIHRVVAEFETSRRLSPVPDFVYSRSGIRPFNDEYLYWLDTSGAGAIDASA